MYRIDQQISISQQYWLIQSINMEYISIYSDLWFLFSFLLLYPVYILLHFYQSSLGFFFFCIIANGIFIFKSQLLIFIYQKQLTFLIISCFLNSCSTSLFVLSRSFFGEFWDFCIDNRVNCEYTDLISSFSVRISFIFLFG